MRAVTYHGKRDVRVDTVPDPRDRRADGRDRPHHQSPASAAPTCISTRCSARSSTRATSSGMSRWGSSRRSAPSVEHIAPGDRVVIPFNISCGHCWMCDQDLQSQCETTQVREHGKGASLFGYTKLYGQVPGGQAELLRVPQAHYGPIKVPDGPAGRALPLPLRRAADGLAGGRVRRDPRRRQRRRVRPRPDRPDVRADRQAPRRRPGVRDRPRARAARAGGAPRHRDARHRARSTTSATCCASAPTAAAPTP